MRKVVLYIGSIFLPDKSAGAQRALSLSKSFRDLGYKVVLVGMSEKGKLKKDILKTKGICEGFDTYSVKKPTSMKDWVHHTVSISEFIAVINYYGVENIYSIVAMEYEAIALYRLVKYCKKHGIELMVDAEEWYGPSQLHFPMNIAKNFDTFLSLSIYIPLFAFFSPTGPQDLLSASLPSVGPFTESSPCAQKKCTK